MERIFSAPSALALVACVLATLALGSCGRSTPAPGGNVKKIITLMPSGTELVAALGAADRLVGVDDYSTYPPSVAALPKVGTFLRPDPEAIVRLAPDLVIADDIHKEAAAALGGAGIETLLVPMHALPDLRRAFSRVGQRLGRSEVAAARVRELDQAITDARNRKRGAGLRVLIVIDREDGGLASMIGAAGGSWMDELVTITGATNVLADAPVPYPRVSPEEILRARPDVILDVSYAADPATAAAAWQTLAEVPAVASRRVRVLSAPYFRGPSPRIAEALADLEAALAP